ncbi:TPA: hypothetical protein ACGU4W_001112 [Vibrio vulnificus]|nr:hypothetical protein [Vibrio vulnificus]
MKILIQERSKDIKFVRDSGFDWLMLCFGVFVPLCRGQIKTALRYFIINLFTLGIAWFVLPFTSRKKYFNHLIEVEGYVLPEDFKGVLPVKQQTSVKTFVVKSPLIWFSGFNLVFYGLGIFAITYTMETVLLWIGIVCFWGLVLFTSYQTCKQKYQLLSNLYNKSLV